MTMWVLGGMRSQTSTATRRMGSVRGGWADATSAESAAASTARAASSGAPHARTSPS